MSDFVRKSDVLDLLYGIFDKYKMSTDKNTSIGKSFGTDVFEEIRNMPTAYDVDKVVEELEELKAYKEIGTVEECRNSVLDIQKAYNKAIDDLLGGMNQITYNCQDADELFEKICDLAEQLKAGGKNDNL